MTKLESIRDALIPLLQQIDGTGDYQTDIGKNVFSGQTAINTQEMPCCVIVLGPRTPVESQRDRVTMDCTVTIHGRIEYLNQDPDTLGYQMLGDIQRAIEGSDRTLGGLILSDMNFLRDEVYYPEKSLLVVAVEVDYSIPHIRHWGDPTK